MAYTVSRESFDSLASYRVDTNHRLNWASVFVLPVWLRAWWRMFGTEGEQYLCAVKEGDRVIGIAPLVIKNNEASFIGSADVCDYMDFVVVPGMETDFFKVLLDNLRENGINRLNLESLRSDSTVMTYLKTLDQNRGDEILSSEVAVSFEFKLPATWEEYLGMLVAKQRHELRRKLRRLEEEGRVVYRTVENEAETREVTDTFLTLFAGSRSDKAAFMTSKRAEFFRLIVRVMAEAGFFRFGILEFEARPVAMVMCFDYAGTIYLYNSGYESQYSSLSVGIISKALCIKDGIQRGRKRFDFLKGEERYKHHLGGREMQLYNCSINLG